MRLKGLDAEPPPLCGRLHCFHCVPIVCGGPVPAASPQHHHLAAQAGMGGPMDDVLPKNSTTMSNFREGAQAGTGRQVHEVSVQQVFNSSGKKNWLHICML